MTDTNQDQPESPVKPQVIDLAAEDVTDIGDKPAEQPEDAPPPPPPPPKPKRKSGAGKWLLAALLLGAIGGGWLYRDILSAYLPSSAVIELQNRMGALEANNKALLQQVSDMSGRLDAASSSAAGLDQSFKDVSAAVAAGNGKLAGLEERLAAAEAALASARSDVANLRNAVSAGGAAGGGVDGAALAAVSQRVDALEKDVASLKSGGAPAGDASAASVLSQSLADLKAKIAAGGGYQDEYDRIARMVPAAPGLDVLAAHAALGLPNASGLAAELHALIPELPAPEAPSADGTSSYWDSFWNSLGSIVTIRNIGDSDWPAIAAAAAAKAEAGDVAAAIAAIDAAEGGKPAALTRWRERAAQRLGLEKAVEEASGAVLRQITAMGGAQ